MPASVVHQRIVRATAATLTVTLVDQDGEPSEPAGVVTVRVQRADGTDVLAAGTATSGVGAGVFTATLTPTQTAELDLLTATWAEDGQERAVTLHEIVGGVYFSVAQARTADASITSAKYDDETVREARTEVEVQCEEITGVAWVPRFRRVLLRGSGRLSLVLPDPMVRRVRSIGTVASTGVVTPWSTTDVIQAAASGVIEVGTGFGVDVLAVEYEHGFDRPPADLVKAAIQHTRHQLSTFTVSSLIDRATQVQTIEGQSMQLATPGRFGFETGIPTVDAVYQRYSMRTPGVA